MEKNKTKKKGFFSLIRESMNKTGGCCGPGETCGGFPLGNPKKPQANPENEKTGRDEKDQA